MDAKKIGAFIAASRRARGLTQQQLAGELGVTNRAVSKWETGQGLPDIALLPALAAALGVTVDALLAGGAVEPPPEPSPAPAEPAVSQPEAPALARVPRRQPTRDELNAAVLASRQLPAVRTRRLVFVLLGLAGLAAGIGLSIQNFFAGNPTDPLTLASLAAGLALLGFGALTPWLRSRLWKDLRRLPACTLYKEELQQEDGTTRPYVELALVRRYRGCTVLVWDGNAVPLAVTVPDDTCTDSAAALYEHLKQRVPAVCGGSEPRSTRLRPGRVLLALAITAAVVFPLALAPELGFAGAVSPTGTVLMLRRDPETGVVTDLHSGQHFAYPAVGRLKKQWLTGDCCAITYQTTDGTTHVHMATYGDRGSGNSYYYVQAQLYGTWRQYDSTTDPGLVLRNVSGIEGVIVEPDAASGQYPETYTHNVQFGTLGLALCDDDGLPQWTVALGSDFVADSGEDKMGTIILCPVSMAHTEAITLHYYSNADQQRDKDIQEQQEQKEAEIAAFVPGPSDFSGMIDHKICTNGVFFTWDGGTTCSHPVDGSAGIYTEEDLGPCIQTEGIGAFLITTRNQDRQEVVLHLTHDQGASWQEVPLAVFDGVHDVSQRSLGFLGDAFGWYGFCTDWSMGTGMGMAIGTTRDGGATWQSCALPGESQSELLSGVVFCDEQTAVATRCSQFESGWIDVFVSQDGGASWQQATMPWDDESLTDEDRMSLFADRELYWLNKAADLRDLGDHWLLTLTQAPDGRREATFLADSLTGPWTLQDVRTVS